MKTLAEKSGEAVSTAVEILRNGGVIAVPTETVYGLVTLWHNDQGRERIYSLKHRPAEKRLQMLAGSLESAARAGVKGVPGLDRVAARFWPGPLTVILPAAGGDSIGLRMPNHRFLLNVLGELDEPLAATSANLSGRPPASCALDAVAELDGEPDLLIDGGSPSLTGGTASSVISLLGPDPVLLRAGAVTLEEFRAALDGK